jgi:hypothetical protein
MNTKTEPVVEQLVNSKFEWLTETGTTVVERGPLGTTQMQTQDARRGTRTWDVDVVLISQKRYDEGSD